MLQCKSAQSPTFSRLAACLLACVAFPDRHGQVARQCPRSDKAHDAHTHEHLPPLSPNSPLLPDLTAAGVVSLDSGTACRPIGARAF
jgi:hypothetical protein